MTSDSPGRTPQLAPNHEWPGLMVRAQAGDQRAYNDLLRAITPAIRAIARRRVSDEQQLADVTQDALLTLHKIRHTYDPARPILPWIFAITSARAIDSLRRTGRRGGREVHDEAAMLIHPDKDAVSVVDSLAAQGELAALLQHLPARQRRIVELVRLRDVSVADVAAADGTTAGAIKALLHRALETLRHHGANDHGQS